MQLYFVRHGQAEEHADEGDAARRLTSEGAATMKRVGRSLRAAGVKPDAIVTSPLVRAFETAEILRSELDLESPPEIDDRLGPGFSLEHLKAIVSRHPPLASILLVGHEPTFSETIGRLTGGSRIDMKKGGVARIDVQDASMDRGVIVWLAPPKLWKRNPYVEG